MEWYRIRNYFLRAMGYKTYAKYLKSSLWADIRRQVLDRDGGKCQICASTEKVQAHHRNYEGPTLEGKTISGIISLCRKCHTEIEFHPKGKKKGFFDVERCLAEKLSAVVVG